MHAMQSFGLELLGKIRIFPDEFQSENSHAFLSGMLDLQLLCHRQTIANYYQNKFSAILFVLIVKTAGKRSANKKKTQLWLLFYCWLVRISIFKE
jgi:hypothetical protein